MMIKIGKNVYHTFSKALEYYYIDTEITETDEDYIVTYSVTNGDCIYIATIFDTDDLKNTIECIRSDLQAFEKALEIMEYLESFDIVYEDEDIAIDNDELSEISRKLLLYLDSGRFDSITDLLKKHEPKKPDFIDHLNEEKIEAINKILRQYHAGMWIKSEVMSMVQSEIHGIF